MYACPFCDAQNIVGVDVCEECGQPLGDVHLSDPTTHVERALLKDRVAILQPRPAITVSPSDTVDMALNLLSKNRIGCVLVVDGDTLVGILSERDVVLRIGPDIEQVRLRPVSDFMTPNVQTLESSAKVAFAVHMMDLGHYRHVPIVDDRGKLKGIISVRDILRYLADRITAA
jgi:CBS domain-containing protein